MKNSLDVGFVNTQTESDSSNNHASLAPHEPGLCLSSLPGSHATMVTDNTTFDSCPNELFRHCFGISLAPGNFIRVVTESSPYQAASNGTISSDGTIVSATDLADGTYSIVCYGECDDEVTEETLTVTGGKAVQTDLYNKLFTVISTTTSSNVYMVEQLTLGEDGMVDVVATEFSATSALNSLMALDVLDDAAFTTEG